MPENTTANGIDSTSTKVIHIMDDTVDDFNRICYKTSIPRKMLPRPICVSVYDWFISFQGIVKLQISEAKITSSERLPIICPHPVNRRPFVGVASKSDEIVICPI